MNFSRAIRRHLGRRSSIIFWVAGALCLTLIVTFWWLITPNYVAVYKQTDENSQAAILATLSRWQIPYRITDGVINVPETSLAKARMSLAEAGIPGRHTVGFELFDQADYGLSEFAQRINYQRALEGELARTVMSFNELEDAHVHLSLKKTGLYQGLHDVSKASVIVRVQHGALLTTAQVMAIQQLLASAVESLDPEHVNVINTQGQVLSVDRHALALPERMQLAATAEHALEAKAKDFLGHTFAADTVSVSVRVALNFDRIKRVIEQPIAPANNSLGVLQREKSQSSATASEVVTGKRSENSRDSEYVVGKEHVETESASGTIARISVAVLLPAGASAEITNAMHSLLVSALGLELSRGDQLTIAYMPALVPDSSAQATQTIARSQTSTNTRHMTPVNARLSTWGIAAGAVCVLLSLAAGFAFWRNQQHNMLTDDAAIRLDPASPIAARVGADKSATLSDDALQAEDVVLCNRLLRVAKPVWGALLLASCDRAQRQRVMSALSVDMGEFKRYQQAFSAQVVPPALLASLMSFLHNQESSDASS